MKRVLVILIAMMCFLTGCSLVSGDVSEQFSALSTSNSKNEAISTSSSKIETVGTSSVDEDILSITLYHKEQMFSDAAEMVTVIDDTEHIRNICKIFSNADWQSRDEGNWVKCQPKFATYILVFKQNQGTQTVVHIPYADKPYIAVGVFDGGLTYTEIFETADADQKKGVEHFKRYIVDEAVTTQVCDLF